MEFLLLAGVIFTASIVLLVVGVVFQGQSGIDQSDASFDDCTELRYSRLGSEYDVVATD